MTPPNTPTSSDQFPKGLLVRWLIAVTVLVSVGLVFFARYPDNSTLVENDAPAHTLANEPVNLVQEARSREEESRETPAPSIERKTYFVSPDGDDRNTGLTLEQAWATIQRAVDQAAPGETIRLADGEYFQDIVSRASGSPGEQIAIIGSQKAIVRGGGYGRVVEINHDYLTLSGFTVDGRFQSSEKEGDYRDKLIFVLGKSERRGVTGLRIENMLIQNAGGECVRLRYFAERNEIAHNVIRNCGVADFVFDKGGKNGEGIYIGTAPEQRDDGTNPTKDTDVSSHNWIHHNTFDTRGNECVDIKEGSTKNIVEFNSCTGQQDRDSAGMGSRGNENVFRHNEIFGNRGAGIRLGGDKKEHGIGNFIHNNVLRDNQEGGIKIMRQPQGNICDNTFSGNKEGKFVGEYSDDFKDEPCSRLTPFGNKG